MTTSGLGSAANGITFADCSDVEDVIFSKLYRDVLQPSFRPTELNDFEQMRAAYLTPLPGRLGTIAFRSGEPVGVALGEHDFTSGVMLLGYLAVRADQRGRGTGSALLSSVLPRWQEIMRPVTILAEVEDPRFYEADPYGDPAARLRMYERLGWRLLPVPYFQPALRENQSRVRGMLLISFMRDDSLPAKVIVDFLDTYMADCEGIDAVRTDPEYLALRRRVSSWSDRIPLWPISRANEVPVD